MAKAFGILDKWQRILLLVFKGGLLISFAFLPVGIFVVAVLSAFRPSQLHGRFVLGLTMLGLSISAFAYGTCNLLGCVDFFVELRQEGSNKRILLMELFLACLVCLVSNWVGTIMLVQGIKELLGRGSLLT
jgi:hypothetical protein